MNDNYFFGIDSTLDDTGVETFVAFLLKDLDDDDFLKPHGMAAYGETPYKAIGSLCDILIAKEIEDTKVVTYEVKQDKEKRFVVKSSKSLPSDVAKHDLPLTESWAIAKFRTFLLEWQHHYSRHNGNEGFEKIASDLQQIYDLEYALDEKERANESE